MKSARRLLRIVDAELNAQPKGRFDALDGLRAIGVLLVLCHHCVVAVGLEGAPGLVPRFMDAGWIGVDIFFVLSGFLIGRILLEQLARGGVDYGRFYLRRALRIFPPYYVVLTLSVFVFARLDGYQGLYGGAAWPELVRRSAANYLYLSNYAFGRAVPNAFSWGWSLCVEEHFYLLLPAFLSLLFYFARGRARFAALGAAALLPLAARAAEFARAPGALMIDGPYYESHAHADGLLLGVLIAYAFVFERSALRRAAARAGGALWIAGAACLIAGYVWGGLKQTGFFAFALQLLAYAVGAGLLVVNGLVLDNAATRLLSHPAWRPIARISYGIYLVHPFAIFWVYLRWPGLVSLAARSSAGLIAYAAASLAAAFAAALILFFAVERPMLALGAPRPRGARGAAA
jgi:peptidoglycan/LPS O-acetylase OafA/YrhL